MKNPVETRPEANALFELAGLAQLFGGQRVKDLAQKLIHSVNADLESTGSSLAEKALTAEE